MDKRRKHRHQVAWRGIITHGADNARIDCVVADVSAIGMRLKLAANQALPETFLVKIPNGSKSFRCRLSWRRGAEAGVEFVGMRPRWKAG